MDARKDALTSEQIDTARRMRQEDRATWYRISRTLKCDPDTLRRLLEPGFAEHRRTQQAQAVAARKLKKSLSVKERCAEFKPKQSFKKDTDDCEPTGEEKSARRRATRQDDAFIDAMTKAVRAERETCLIGIDTRPGTSSPQLVESRSNGLRSVTGSSAQMCADFA